MLTLGVGLIAGRENTACNLGNSRALTDTANIEKATAAEGIRAKAFLLKAVSCCLSKALHCAYSACGKGAKQVALGKSSSTEGGDGCKDRETHFTFFPKRTLEVRIV